MADFKTQKKPRKLRRYLLLLLLTVPAALITRVLEDWLELPQILWYPPIGLLMTFLLIFFGLPWVADLPSCWIMFKERKKRHDA